MTKATKETAGASPATVPSSDAAGEPKTKVIKSSKTKTTLSALIKCDCEVHTEVLQHPDGNIMLEVHLRPSNGIEGFDGLNAVLAKGIVRSLKRTLKPTGATAQALKGKVDVSIPLAFPTTFSCKMGL